MPFPPSPAVLMQRLRSMLRLSLPVVALCSLLQSVSIAAEEGATPLFNGTSLEAWTQKGGEAKYAVEGEEIVGTSVIGTPNSFLCTNKPYQNFILDLDVKVDPLLNSGIQIRSNSFEEPKTYEFADKAGAKQKVTVPAQRVHGYQVEIDPSPRGWSGGIYDESRRGWLSSPTGENNAAARAAFKNGEWNHYRIEANGPSIKTSINGVPVADLNDGMTDSGFIALQVHGIGNDQAKVGKQVRWKNIMLKELPATPADSGKPQWLTYKGTAGPGLGKKIVLISGDEEYRSEEALPQLAKILSERQGFDCTVLFAVDPETGYVNPNVLTNIPGLEALDTADLMVIFTRFRNLPDAQMQHVDQYLKSGKPVLGIRTATHAFNPPEKSTWAQYANGAHGHHEAWTDGFGRLVLGEKWHTHHGKHKHQSARGMIAPGATEHPILRGVKDGEIWGSTDVYGVRLPLPGDSQALVLGQVVNRAGEYDANDKFYGMRDTDKQADPALNDPMMPIVWLKSYQLPDGQPGKSMTSTIGAAIDMTNTAVRKELVNGVLFLLDMADKIPADGANVEVVGDFNPSAYGFRSKEQWTAEKKTVEDFK
ncbi:3-keto-disaccharide hydrolase [Planctomicrobium piriforme]|uniref:Trehalose utilisation n=1 Tax=Planctomicrobium piriforme TaxID=1576369 RepID=A0A1I3E4S2_9PLAN|nr:DUF1080 domain-containing protein [Planctomicrobium piriforme]SFH94022.1 Trehalose utilisation [Planctomicrobium piriforme]